MLLVFNTGLLLLLYYHASSVVAIRFVFQIDDIYQPFVVNIQYETDTIPQQRQYQLSAQPPSSSTYTQIEFVPKTSDSFTNVLISACASRDRDPDYPDVLYQNHQNEITCSQAFRPTMYRLNDDISYGVHGDGVKYSVGYWVDYMKPSLVYESFTAAVTVGIYDIVYSTQHGLLYTTHIIYPGTEITLDGWIKSQGKTLFRSYYVHYPTQYDESLVQLVPFEDMIPMPWKIGTLMDINFIQVDTSIKNGLNIINKCLRNHVGNTNNPLKVFSGVMGDAWYWKMVENGGKAVMISIMNPNAGHNSTPCEVGGCQEFGLGILEEQLANVYCCKVTQWIANTLNLVSFKSSSNPDYMIFEEKLVLLPSA